MSGNIKTANPEMARGNDGFKPSVYNADVPHEYDDTCACTDCLGVRRNKFKDSVVMVKVTKQNPELAKEVREQTRELLHGKPQFDVVTKSPHYNQGKIEVWDFILDQDLNFLAATAVKYLCRYRFKGTPLQDLKKARAYLDKLISTWETET